MTSAAIMQPTYLPWSGYFALMDAVDVFVVLDSVQFARRSWQQRNRIKGPDGASMLTVPVRKGPREQRIDEVEIDVDSGYAVRHRRAIELAYARAPAFEQYAHPLLDTIEAPPAKLVDLNLRAISNLRDVLGIETRVVRSSKLASEGRKADLLAGICAALEVDTYISPPGSRDYLDESDALSRRGIELRYLQFEHPVHAQLHGAFESHLSVVDLLFNVGDDALGLIRSGTELAPA